MTEHNTHFAQLIGRGALSLWPDLPREVCSRKPWAATKHYAISLHSICTITTRERCIL